MNVSIIAIGDELLIGQVIDTNSGDLAHRMNPSGWRVNDVQVVADKAEDIIEAIEKGFAHSDVILTTGGLGPTKDDITKATLCHYFGGELKENPEVLKNVEKVVTARGLKLNELTSGQAIVPTSCTVIQNDVGTAPIMWFERDGKVLVAMPGVPYETREMFDKKVFPLLQNRFVTTENIEHRTVQVVGYTESLLAMKLSEWENSLPEYLHLAYLPRPGLVRLRIDGTHNDNTFLINEINRYHTQLCHLLGNNVICDEDIPLEELVLLELKNLGMKISTAESCTGGNIAHLLTSVPGSSTVYNGSVVAYSNDVKRNILGVEENTLAEFGAVSEPVVKEMAEGVAKALNTDFAIATSGIAGPDGGTATKPVGTVCIGIKTPEGTFCYTHRFPGNRQRVIVRASMTALILAIEKIKSTPRRLHDE